MKPTNVVHHVHFFPNDDWAAPDGQRGDACELTDGRFVVWRLSDDSTIDCATWAECYKLAREMAPRS